MDNKSLIFIPILIIFVIVFSIIKKKNAYDSFIKGSKEGLGLFKEVFPSIIAMLLCVNLLKASGIISDISNVLSSFVPGLGGYTEIVPMVIFRPISGSASIAVLDSICKADADSFVCKMASTIQGSTDTTIYVLCLYFTSVGVKKWKHALKVGLFADVVGIAMGVILAFLFLR